MDQSILTGTKKILGLDESYTAFDPDIITHINSVFGTLNQLGVGIDTGFTIEDASAVWTDFIAEGPMLGLIRTYVYLKVRVLFDPPTLSYLIEATNNQIKELEWRISTMREATGWTDPTPIDPTTGEY